MIDKIRDSTLQWELNDFIQYSLPDGLWMYAFSYFLISIWKYERGFEKYVFLLIPIILGIGGECIQLFIPRIGTFDLNDLFISIGGYILAYSLVREREN